ncbi:hypothetical protein GN234_03820 [Pseudomonas bijieensis]|uniref:Uncharacterized protein n=2 Tax=Pseudomonas TaxID=286 RepID=A0A6N1C7B8_9PSED|nr:hypothetical protein DZG01_09785 [Pseudomonas fluorescens]QIB08715.1 hypothetical protein GZ982_29680 [Pseudomonas fluorescens]QKS81124.1 hypothetical protein GN234_03820 [Pseudomonas bijieensis]
MKPIGSATRITMAGALVFCQVTFAHGPVFDCYIEGDNQVKCEAGFTDGSSAAGRKIHVQDPSNKVLLEGEVGKDNAYTFQPPAGNYSVVFLGGAGHELTIQSSDISR